MATFPIMSIINITATAKFNLAFSDIFVVLLGVVWLLDIKNFKLKQNYPYFWYFGGLIVLLVLSGIYNLNSNVVSSGIAGMISEGLKFLINAVYLFIGYNSCRDKQELKNIVKAWLVGLWIFMLYGLYKQMSVVIGLSFLRFNNAFGDGSRFLGTITDPNAAALYLSISFFVITAARRYLFEDSKMYLFLNGTNIVVFVCAVLTLSRGGIIGFACGIGLYIVLNIRNIIKKLYLIPIFIIILISLVFVDVKLLGGNFTDSFVSRFTADKEQTSMLKVRYCLSFAAIDMGLDNPIIGVGRGNYPLNSKEYIIARGGNWEKDAAEFYNHMVPHNTLAAIYAELGIIGLLLFVSIFIIMVYKLKKANNIDFVFKTLMISMWGCIFVQSLSICLENSRYVWIIVGMSLMILDRNIKTVGK
jgi:O-antigen ligase